jgi:N-acetylmuramoyl-L-alanine amidase
MSKMTHLVVHTTDTPYNREVTPDDIALWHLGAKRIDRGMAIFKNKTIPQAILKSLILHLPSGKTISADKTNGRGWSQVGYSDMINRAGELINLVPYTFDDVVDSFEITNGAVGYNRNSRHVVLVGGWSKDGLNKTGYKTPGNLFLPEDLYTEKQIPTLIEYLEMQKQIVKTVEIVGHNEIAKKPCPNFDVQKFLKLHGLI